MLVCASESARNFNPLPSYEGRLRHRPPVPKPFYFNPLPSYEGRPWPRWRRLRMLAISIHSPHTRGDVSYDFTSSKTCSFQSTPLIRGETPRGRPSPALSQISIHSPHTRGDFVTVPKQPIYYNFNPLPSYEGRLGIVYNDIVAVKISIHSPHTRGDGKEGKSFWELTNFNPLPSYEGRHTTRQR